MLRSSVLVVSLWSALTTAIRYSADEVGYNLNENQTATNPVDYWGEWPDHTFHPSPSNWRMPMYTLFLDRYVNGDPTNDNANGTQFEHDILSNQLRYGGDLKGLQATLDYLQGMGVRTLYLAGSPMLNMPWASDGYSPLDLTLLDRHFGDIDTWREVITDIHSRGMYVVFDNTFATMGDLMGFEGYLNDSTPFNPAEHNVIWKSDRRYHDFHQSDAVLDECTYPRFWGDDGLPVTNLTGYFTSCRDSEFDQYGEVASFGNYQEYQRQLSKFAFVQDRLREWKPDVLAKIELFSCITIAMLDIDGFRIDKALQVTIDAQGEWSAYIRDCARQFNKTNFYIPGEIVAGNAFGAVYIGRGMQPEMAIENLTEIVTTTNETDRTYIRDFDHCALDAAAFHYSVYRGMTRFLGMDGIYEAEGDPPVNFVETWNVLLQTNDMINANTGQFDPRHMYGVTNQDVFRWPGIKNGTEKQLLGLFVVELLLPGIPTLSWGEEQAFYVLENTASNYVFGRPPMSSSLAWQLHGCYKVGSVKYANFPLDAALYGCEDDNISLDHRDPSHPVRNIIKSMHEMRENYPVLNDGYYLQQLSNHTYDIFLPGSNHTPTETGLWSVYRSAFSGVQNFTGIGQGGQSVWLLYSNENRTVDYNFDCSANTSLVAPFDEGLVVKNLFAPYEEYTLATGSKTLGLEGSTKPNGCIANFSMPAWGFKALVPKDNFVAPRPVLTAFSPGHDFRVLSTDNSGAEKVHIKIAFSQEMDCDALKGNLRVNSTVQTGGIALLDASSVQCSSLSVASAPWVGTPPTAFVFEGDLVNIHHGVHQITIQNATSTNGNFTNSVDHFLLRVGDFQNPMVFPKAANYSTELLFEDEKGLYVSHRASGADLWRYTLNFGTTYSNWTTYTGENSTLDPRVWSGTKHQAWKGQHVMVQYWSQLAGSADHYVHGDLESSPRRFPNLFLEGTFNQHGFDMGLSNQLELDADDGLWKINFMSEWPAQVSFNAWGMNPDGQPDATQVFGDVDGDFVLDRIPPQSLLNNVVNLTLGPPSPYVAYRLELNDGSFRYQAVPVGSRWAQLALYLLLAIIPILTAVAAALIYVQSFYQIKYNKYGVSQNTSILPAALRGKLSRLHDSRSSEDLTFFEKASRNTLALVTPNRTPQPRSPLTTAAPTPMRGRSPSPFGAHFEEDMLHADAGAPNRRTVLIATMEYDIEDWNIKIKIGGLGVMAQLMGKNLGHQDLIWVVPCVAGVDYPQDPAEDAEPMRVTVLGQSYQVEVRTHVLRNITYVLLDAPVFRQQTKSEPYPPRMDDLDSAIYYSAWNSCIAEAIRRYNPDLYHINDYHGAVAPLHLLPHTIPCALSLHNAEFQGLWPMRSKQEREEVCKIYNLEPEVVQEYVQFGEVFNLLHAGASYLRIHQKGFGAVGVSKKYGKRSYARYPIFWGLKDIGALPNPDPSDTAEWSRDEDGKPRVDPPIDHEFEASRGALRMQAQKWAGLDEDADAELFVFVGRWSMQKGVDLIADIFPSILEKHPKTQLICIGPVIDLYGKFAAIKLGKMMSVYPGRVYSKPEFTALPPYIFSGAEFALIPSRDEPFGLVAVEFGRKGALGVGARVGGLGQMPGWWYTVESTSTKHLLHQFKGAIEGALASTSDVRAKLRARSGQQRFPVAQWVQDLETLQTTAIKKHEKYSKRASHASLSLRGLGVQSGKSTPRPTGLTLTPGTSARPSAQPTPNRTRNSSPVEMPDDSVQTLRRMGSRRGPGHSPGVRTSEDNLSEVGDQDEETLSEGDEESRGRQLRARDLVQPQIFLESAPVRGTSPSESRSTLNWPLPLNFGTDNFPSPLPSPLASPLASPRGLLFQEGASGASTPNLERPQEDASLLTVNARTTRPDLGYRQTSGLSLASVVGEKKNFELQKVNPFFTDANQDYTKAFEKKLANLSAKTSYNTCIEEFIEKSEKDWFNRYREVKMGRSATPASSIFRNKRDSSPTTSLSNDSLGDAADLKDEQFLLQADYKPPTGVKKFLLHRLGDWPLYSMLLAFGQIIAANSYQITLLTGEVGEAATKLYVVATIYLVTSILWWTVFRCFKSIYCLSLPFVFYGLAFFFIGVAPLVSGGREWVQNVATACYAIASSSGSLFFALNFGDQGGAPVTSWVFRACVIQGTQQIYIAALWWWGSALAKLSAAGTVPSSIVATQPAVATSIGMTVAVVMWAVGILLFLGLPDYYRQSPGTVPSFLASIFRRRIVLWFFMTVLIQNFFLSAPYGRNWLYLWSSQHVAPWQIALLTILFFLVIWALFLYMFNILSKSHSWILPLFAIGLGAPRWCQMLWGVSGIGEYVPWAGSPVGSALAGRSLWLWLGVLDALQGVGFGMILLHTLTRFHISFTLIVAQVLGSIATIAARGFGPNSLGPGPVFPNFGLSIAGGLQNAWFWIALFCQLAINGAAFKFFRKEQLSKP